MEVAVVQFAQVHLVILTTVFQLNFIMLYFIFSMVLFSYKVLISNSN